ncbi:MAG: lipid-A-disaccharide synthase [Bacteroidales bacterium]|nr:lipid-A-disaccharide synthase [Bacteroidales bacterium]
MKYYIIAGEASGDLHASNLMQAIKEKDENAEFRFFGGDLMQQVGGTLVKHYRELAFMGFVPVLLNLKTILRNLEICKKDIVKFVPDVVILVDYPGFNLKIAKYLKQNTSIPVTYYISPKIWAWKEYRIKDFKKYVDQMLCILPFEVDFYKKHNYPVSYVGNPTVDAIEKREDKDQTFQEFIELHKLDDKPIIAILAGSRKQEIEDNLPHMLKAIEVFKSHQVVIAGAPGIDKSFYNKTLQNNNATLLFGQTYNILSQANVALVTSGTATLETALLNVPQVVCYKTPIPKLVYWVFKNMLHTPYISLVNLIANKKVVRELFAKFFSVENIHDEIEKLLFDPKYRKNMLSEYKLIQEKLGTENASNKAAKLIYDRLTK